MHHADAAVDRCIHVFNGERLAEIFDGSLIHGVNAGETFHQRRLARAVLADQHMNLAAQQIEIHVLQRLDAGKVFADAPHFQYSLAHVKLLLSHESSRQSRRTAKGSSARDG